MSYGKHPYYQTPKERDRERFNDDIEATFGTRKVPQYDIADGVKRPTRERLGNMQAWRVG